MEFVSSSMEKNLPPETPKKPNGIWGGSAGVEYEFSTFTVDPNGDAVYYLWDWDDNTESNWRGPYSSGETCVATHTWEHLGSYKVKVKAKDYELQSGWSKLKIVSMPRNNCVNLLSSNKIKDDNKSDTYLNVINNDRWLSETIDYTGGSFTKVAFQLDSNDLPNVVYWDSYEHMLKYAYLDNISKSWIIQTIDSVGSVGFNLALDIDSDNKPHICYQGSNGGTNHVLKYAYKDNSGWVIQTVDSNGDVGYWCDIALYDNTPHISYYDKTNGHLKYAYCYDNWSIDIADSNDDFGLCTSIEVDYLGYPHIAYTNFEKSILKYSIFNGTSWIITTIDTSMKIACPSISIDLDYHNYAHISYIDENNHNLKYAYENYNGWTIVPVDTVAGKGTDIELDKTETVHIIYHEIGNNNDIKYAIHTNYGWIINKIDANSPDNPIEPGCSALSLNNQGNANIGYLVNQNNIYVIKYALITGWPDKPAKPTGPEEGKVGETYTYITRTNDPNGDDIYYLFEWGAHRPMNSGWIGPYLAGDVVNTPLTWNNTVIGDLKVKALDRYGAQSIWSDPLPIIIPKSKSLINSFFQILYAHINLLSKFPNRDRFVIFPFKLSN